MLDCYEFYLWSIGELILPDEISYELAKQILKGHPTQ